MRSEQTYNLEREWRASLPYWSTKEILETYPEVREMAKDKKAELGADLKGLAEVIKRKAALINEKATTKNGRWFFLEWLKVNEVQDYLEIKSQIKKISFLTNKPSRKVNKNKLTSDMIEEARRVPIEVLINAPRTDTRRFYQVSCPLHNERTPSFTVWRDSNTFKCFGCGEQGSSIDLFMKMHSCDFKMAIRSLVNK